MFGFRVLPNGLDFAWHPKSQKCQQMNAIVPLNVKIFIEIWDSEHRAGDKKTYSIHTKA